jgi:hypothetical protein
LVSFVICILFKFLGTIIFPVRRYNLWFRWLNLKPEHLFLNNSNILKRCPTDLTSIKQAAKQWVICNTVKPVYKGHSKEPENVPFIYGLNYIHYSLMGKIILPFIDSNLLYRGAQVWLLIGNCSSLYSNFILRIVYVFYLQEPDQV